MTARELYHAGHLEAAIQALGAELRDHPMDARRRTFLFELLCFAGQYDRAVKHLDVLASSGPDSATGALLYRAALHADQMRTELFDRRAYPEPHPAPPISGILNGQAFDEIEDADPRIGQRLEIYAAGQCMWLPLVHIASVEISPPTRLRDLLWAPALVRTGPAFQGAELGEVLLPVLAPLSFRHADDNVRLGRSTVWEPDIRNPGTRNEQENGDLVPYGQKMLLVDGEDFPLLEVRRLEITSPQSHASAQ
jgi:type VI secretion system protein ImpE